ncbi:uncharacterized protein LOC124403807 [Silurus meridionalis]|uniref:uncharacterized protein LOC124403807 n=1 Tax=Silurus meridionalis TaxID=175797 RepID=UPI001EEAA578|nr:uncharacterized protein LOC124403807 [Silurus meridionalis]
MKLLLILLSLSDVLTQDSNWGVKYTDNQICAVRGFSVSIPCSYYYPTSKPNIQVKQMLWCSMNSNKDHCHDPPFVYNSSSNTKSDFEFTGDDKSDCTLLIHNVQFSYSGVYKFRFITDVVKGMYTGDPGVTLQVTDSVETEPSNLMNDVNSTQSSSTVVSSKTVPVSGPKNPVWSIWMIVYVIAGVSLSPSHFSRDLQQEEDPAGAGCF